REFDAQSNALLQVAASSRIATASMTAAQLSIEYATIRAPIAGRIGRALVTPGNLVSPGSTPLATLVSVDPMHVYVDVDEARALRYRGQVGAGQLHAHVGFADEDGYPHDGVIDFIDNRVDEATGTVKARAVIANPDGRLSPGLFARMRLPASAERDALLVSDRAIGTDQSRKFVYVVGPDDKVESRTVKLGPLHDGLRVVREGVTGDDRVVVNGLQRVRPGSAVSAKVVAMKESERTAPAPGATP
ncbi:MAG: efflux RND transporter periplasmic adaptor subunit, partial [Myxococcales bacterium]